MKNSYLARRIEESFKKNIEELPLAYIWDRLAAFVVDLIILSIFINILVSPLKRKIQTAILDEHEGAVNLYIFCIVLVACGIFLAYQTASVFLFKKTIGKKLFHLEVAPIIHGHQLTLVNSFVRACSLLFSIILFLFPLLEIFSNRLRRPMHDKLADSYVKGNLKVGESPSPVEKLWVRFVYMIVMANLTVVMIAQFFFFKEDFDSLSEFVTQPEYLCEAVSEAKETWPKNDKASRLEIALTLHSIEAIDEECLEKEAQRALSYGEELDRAYLAKAFVYEGDTEISDKYLEKVCELDTSSETCLLTQMIELWSDKDWLGADIIWDSANLKSAYMKVWAIKHYDKTQNYEKLLAIADDLWPNKSLNDFIGKYKTITLWNLDKTNESKELFQSTYAHLPEDKKTSFLSDVCNLEIEKNCSVSEFSGCKLLIDKMRDDTNDSIHEETLLTYVKTNKCGMTDVEDVISEYRISIEDPYIKMYLAALRAQKMGKNSVAEQIYKNILKGSSSSSFLSYEVRSNLIELADEKDFSEQMDWWLTADAIGAYHQQLGLKFLKLLSEKKKWDTAEPVAKKLLASSFRTREQNEMVAVVFFNLKKFSIARRVIDSLERAKTRAIASQNDFEEVKKQLLKPVNSGDTKFSEEQ